MQRIERNEAMNVPVFFAIGVEYMTADLLTGLFAALVT